MDAHCPTEFSVHLAPQGWRFACAPDQSLLLGALAAGVRLPHACRNGTCRACMTQLLSGQIHYRIDWPGLSREEKAQGWILPCVAEPRSDLQLLTPQATTLDQPATAGQPPGAVAQPPD